ncbi:MAG: hypothetical protein ACOYD9_07395 [Pyramidobacter sp.]|jgi:hypothetical protein
MIIDNNLLFGILSADAAGALPNVIDAKAAGDAILDELYLHVRSYGNEAPAGLTSVGFSLQTADKEDFAADVETLMTGTAKLENGKIAWAGRVPLGCRRYLRVTMTPEPSSGCTGCLTAFLTHGPQHSYEDFEA